jgi:outer membrane protein TolC
MKKRMGVLVSLAALAVAAAPQDGEAQSGAKPASEQAAYRLTIEDAIQRGLQANLRVLAAQTRIDEASGAQERRWASLLPRARAEGAGALQNRSLRAFGITLPGAPATVPPFSTYDLRLYAEQPIVDLPNYHAWKASGKQIEAARQDYQDARDTIIRVVAGLYLNAQSAAARVAAAESRAALAEDLLKLASERRSAGVATGVDVLRAQVQLSNEQQRLLEARNAAKAALLLLARNIGMSPGTPLELAEALEFKAVETPAMPGALATAFENRADYVALRTQREALVEQQKAIHGRYLPRFGLSGNWGGIGRSFGEIRPTGAIQGTVGVTLFDRDREGEQKESQSRIQRLDQQMADLRLGIEAEIREAALQLESASEEVKVALQGRELAQKELELARERFQAGVTNNIEVTSAQDALERAQENSILALTRHADARIALARALGGTEKNYRGYLGTR